MRNMSGKIVRIFIFVSFRPGDMFSFWVVAHKTSHPEEYQWKWLV